MQKEALEQEVGIMDKFNIRHHQKLINHIDNI